MMQTKGVPNVTILYIACSVVVGLILVVGLIDLLFGDRLRRSSRFLENNKPK